MKYLYFVTSVTQLACMGLHHSDTPAYYDDCEPKLLVDQTHLDWAIDAVATRHALPRWAITIVSLNAETVPKKDTPRRGIWELTGPMEGHIMGYHPIMDHGLRMIVPFTPGDPRAS